MMGVLIFALIFVRSQSGFAYTIHIHQEYDGPWHWDELTRNTINLNDTTYQLTNGERYPVVIGDKFTGTAVITGRKTEDADMTIPPKIEYEWWSTGPWGENQSTHLLSLTVGDFDVVSIGDGAFRSCNWLKTLTISNGVKNIGSSAFYGCSGLTNVTIPGSVTDIGNSAFSGCTNLTSVYVSDIAKWCSISFGTSDANPLYYAHNLYRNGYLVKYLTIPNGVTSIGDYAFYNCSGLTSVTIGNGVTNIGVGAFYGCSGLKDITVPQYVCTNRTSALFPAARQSITNVVISEGVTSIGNRAFSYCGGLIGVTIPDGVTNIDYYAFQYCSNLVNVTIPSSVASIGEGAFAHCSGLMSVTIPDSVMSIGASAFYGCSNLTGTFPIPTGVTGIENATFYGCSGLTSVTIPNSVMDIGDSAFKGCSNLVSMTIPNSVTNIGITAFQNCINLTYVSIPDSMTNIGRSVFYGCSGLTSVTIGNGVTSIGDGAFQNCSRLTSVTFNGNAPTVGTGVFASVGTGCTAYVNKSSTGWGVEIPGEWNGIRIEYLNDDVTVDVGNGVKVSVPDQWIGSYTAIVAGDGDKTAALQREAANGRKVWQCYVLGLDPEQADDDFRITRFWMDGNVPMFEFSHTSDGSGNTFVPRIRKLGSATPSGPWQEVPAAGNPAYRFFKAEVALP